MFFGGELAFFDDCDLVLMIAGWHYPHPPLKWPLWPPAVDTPTSKRHVSFERQYDRELRWVELYISCQVCVHNTTLTLYVYSVRIKVVRQIWSIGSEKSLFSCTSNHETPSLPKNVMLRWQLCYINGDSLVSSVHSLSGYGHNASSASIVVKSTVRSFTKKKKKHTPDFFLPALFYPQTLN